MLTPDRPDCLDQDFDRYVNRYHGPQSLNPIPYDRVIAPDKSYDYHMLNTRVAQLEEEVQELRAMVEELQKPALSWLVKPTSEQIKIFGGGSK